MKKYVVTIGYHTYAKVKVVAENEEDALDRAREEISDQELLDNLEEVDTDVE